MGGTADIMNTTRTCERCRTVLSPAHSRNLCPACLFDTALDPYDMAFASLPPASDAPVEPPSNFGEYELLGELGRGGQGLVFRARHRRLGRLVALKTIPASYLAGPHARERFLLEARTASRLDHPNLVPVYDVGECDGFCFYSMKLIEGSSLDRVGLATPDAAALAHADHFRHLARILRKIALALAHAHQRGVLHRDLKPSNILLDAEHEPYLADFGLARDIDQASTLTAPQAWIGTPAYLAPEIVQHGASQATTASDIYGLGAILYFLLSGQPPFSGGTLAATLHAVQHAEPAHPSTLNPANPALPADLATICLQCLEKEPARRYASAQDLAADLQRFLEGEPVAARPITPAQRAWRWCRRHRTLAAAASLIIVAVLAGTAVSTWALIRERAARSQADHRLKTALAFVDEVFTQVAPEISDVAGAAKANEKLAQSGLRFVQNLRDGLGDEPALRLAVARQLLWLSRQQNPGSANTLGNYRFGLAHAREAQAVLNDSSLVLHGPARIELVYSARYAAAQCLAALGQIDDALIEWRAALPLLDELERFPERSRLARRNRVNILNNLGYALVLANRPQDAVDQYLLPALQGAWTQAVSAQVQTATADELEVLANLRDSLASACLFLERFEQMLPLAASAANLWDHLIELHPRNGLYASARAECLAQQGCALLLTGARDQGLSLLERARQIAEGLVERDRSNDRFLSARTIVAAVRALAFAHWSNERSASIAERNARLQQAETFLADAEQVGRAMKTSISHRYMESARILVANARERLAGANTSPP